MRSLVERLLPAKIDKDLNHLHKDTLEFVVATKALKTSILQDSEFKYLKVHLRRMDKLSEEDIEVCM